MPLDSPGYLLSFYKKIIIAFCIFAVISGIGFGVIRAVVISNREAAVIMEQQREIEEAYRWIHYAIGSTWHGDYWGVLSQRRLEEISTYQPLEELGPSNDFGIFYRRYLILRMYYHRGGVYLSYEKLVDYFSEEFEPDGTLRLYNNGRHPEIEAFVNWMREEPRRTPLDDDQVNQYTGSLDRIYGRYFNEHRDEGFRLQSFHQLSPQMYDALARAEADPNYVLDLTSLQEQGY